MEASDDEAEKVYDIEWLSQSNSLYIYIIIGLTKWLKTKKRKETLLTIKKIIIKGSRMVLGWN